jgi:hypothetical protein
MEAFSENYYALLGVDITATTGEIREAWVARLSQVALLHPTQAADRDDWAGRYNAAWACLQDDDQRIEHDEWLARTWPSHRPGAWNEVVIYPDDIQRPTRICADCGSQFVGIRKYCLLCHNLRQDHGQDHWNPYVPPTPVATATKHRGFIWLCTRSLVVFAILWGLLHFPLGVIDTLGASRLEVTYAGDFSNVALMVLAPVICLGYRKWKQ